MKKGFKNVKEEKISSEIKGNERSIVKIVSYVVVTVLLYVCLANSIFAGQLCQNKQGIYYIEDGGMLAKSKWVALDLDKNGKKEYYFFNAEGFLLTNAITPDGYKVDAQGRWINNGVVVEEGDEAKVVLEGLSSAASEMNLPNVTYDVQPKVYVVRENSSSVVKNIAKHVARGIEQGVKKVANKLNKVFNKYDKKITKEYEKNYQKVSEAIEHANTVNEVENINNMANAYSAGANVGYDAGANAGYDAGANVGYDAGANAGYDVGVNDGYDIGASDAYNVMDQLEGKDTK